MADLDFTHIHCSSRWDRSPEGLEHDVDQWREKSSLITLTEVDMPNKAATLSEKGWGYYNHPISHGQDNCAVCWDLSVWKRKSGWVRKLSNNTFYRLNGKVAAPIHSCSVLLVHKDSGKKLLVSVTHFPAHVEGKNGWGKHDAKWAARKQAWLSSLKNWSAHIKDMDRKKKPDGILVIADWNLNLKHDWVRDLLRTHWGKEYRQAWKQFPTEGGSMLGGPPSPPLGAPGTNDGGRIIDGTLYKGLKSTKHPNLMARVRSSDHRPYIEKFRFRGKGEKDDDDDSGGDTKPGDAWWGFGDYMDDELYEVARGTGETGGEVL